MKEKIENIYNILDNKFYFKLLYLFVSLTFVTIFKCIPGIRILNKVVLAWGILLLFFMLISDYKKRKIYKFDIPLFIFIFITFTFNVFLYRSGKNLEIWIINLIILGVIFTIDVFRNKKIIIKEMNMTTYFYVIFMFITSVISLAMKLFNKTILIKEFVFSGSKGGLFENENALSIAAALSIVMCIYLNHIAKKYKLKMFWLCNIVLQSITMIAFRGRSAYLVVIAVIYTFVYVYNKNKYIRQVLLIIPILMCIGGFALEGEHVRDFTSGRTSLWTSAGVVIKENPLTGVGNSNLVESIKNARETDDLPGLEIGGLHNIYVQTAAVNGIISLMLILTFIGMILAFIVKHLDNLRRKEKMQMTTITSIVVGILAVNLFESTLIYIISFISMIFWIYLGYAVSILDNKNIE